MGPRTRLKSLPVFLLTFAVITLIIWGFKTRKLEYNSGIIKTYRGNIDHLPIPCVILPPIQEGGIGDQLYRYASAYAAARNLNVTLFIATSKNAMMNARQFGTKDRVFALDKFKLNSSNTMFMTETTLRSIPQDLTYHLGELGPWKKEHLPIDKRIVVADYWQSHIYCMEYWSELSQHLVPRNFSNQVALDYLADIEHSESVSVHIRRGDFYINDEHSASFRQIPIEYQLRSIELMQHLLKDRSEPTFFIFSDDINHAKSAMSNASYASRKFVFVSNSSTLTSLEEFHLMCKCKHNIVANSGFSWWTAYLNTNPSKIVMAPFPRHRRKFYDQMVGAYRKQIENVWWNYTYPRSWITLNPYPSFEDSM